jgi:H+/Cl- antiporter ClcA
LTWPQLFGASDDSAGGYILSYLFYVLWAVSFGALAAILVRMFAPYASGGGIPEVIRLVVIETFFFYPDFKRMSFRSRLF